MQQHHGTVRNIAQNVANVAQTAPTQACVTVKLPSSVYFFTQIVAQPYPNVRVIQRSHACGCKKRQDLQVVRRLHMTVLGKSCVRSI
jgi:hypothetical protein